jgi:hypothetical protein
VAQTISSLPLGERVNAYGFKELFFRYFITVLGSTGEWTQGLVLLGKRSTTWATPPALFHHSWYLFASLGFDNEKYSKHNTFGTDDHETQILIHKA